MSNFIKKIRLNSIGHQKRSQMKFLERLCKSWGVDQSKWGMQGHRTVMLRDNHVVEGRDFVGKSMFCPLWCAFRDALYETVRFDPPTGKIEGVPVFLPEEVLEVLRGKYPPLPLRIYVPVFPKGIPAYDAITYRLA